MRKTSPKLALRKETLRALSNIKLAHVAVQGGDAPIIGDVTHENVCPVAVVQKA